MLFRGYALTYMATLSNATTYVLDAHDGHIRLQYSENRNQTSSCRPGASRCAVGVGVGVLGDQKKISTTAAGGAFETRDSLRPVEILTLDVRRNSGTFNRLSGDDGASLGFLPSDVASDGDNDWTDSQVVDAHVHIGWITDYLFRQHGYNGIDNMDGRIFALVNLPDDVANSNAFFSYPPSGPEGTGYMAYGEFDDGVPLTTLDVVGHEVTHGLTFFRPAGNLIRFNFDGQVGSGGCTPGAVIPVVRGGQVVGGLPADFNFEGTGATFFCDTGRFIEGANVAGAVGEGFGDVVGTSAEFFFDDVTTPRLHSGRRLSREWSFPLAGRPRLQDLHRLHWWSARARPALPRPFFSEVRVSAHPVSRWFAILLGRERFGFRWRTTSIPLFLVTRCRCAARRGQSRVGLGAADPTALRSNSMHS